MVSLNKIKLFLARRADNSDRKSLSLESFDWFPKERQSDSSLGPTQQQTLTALYPYREASFDL